MTCPRHYSMNVSVVKISTWKVVPFFTGTNKITITRIVVTPYLQARCPILAWMYGRREKWVSWSYCDLVPVYVGHIKENNAPKAIWKKQFRIVRCAKMTCFLIKQRFAMAWTVRGSIPGPRPGRDFSPPSRPALGPTQPPVQWIPDLSRG